MIDRDIKILLIFVGGKAFVVGFNLFLTLLIGRMLGPEGLGQWSLVLAAAAFLHTTLINWTHASTVRFGCEEWVATGSLKETLSARLPVLLVCLGAAALLLLVQPFQWLERGFGVAGQSWGLVAVYAIGLWLAAEAQATLQAVGRITWQSLLGPIAGIASLGVLFALAVGGWISVSTAVLAVSLTTATVWGGAWLNVLARTRFVPHAASTAEVGRHLSYAGPLLFGFAIGYLSDWGDHLLLRRQTSIETVGLFGLSYQMFATMLAANGALSTLLLPRLVASQLRSDQARGRYVRDVVPTIFVLWALAATAMVAVLPPLLTAAAGERFAPATASLLVLCAVVPTSVVTSLYTVVFSLEKRLGRVVWYTAAMTVVNLALSFLLIPRYGAVGAAVGTAVSYAVAQVCYIWDQQAETTGVGGMWLVIVLCGIAQVWVGENPAARAVWATVSGATIAWTAKRTSTVSAAVVERLFAGVLAPLGMVLRWMLVPKVVR